MKGGLLSPSRALSCPLPLYSTPYSFPSLTSEKAVRPHEQRRTMLSSRCIRSWISRIWDDVSSRSVLTADPTDSIAAMTLAKSAGDARRPGRFEARRGESSLTVFCTWGRNNSGDVSMLGTNGGCAQYCLWVTWEATASCCVATAGRTHQTHSCAIFPLCEQKNRDPKQHDARRRGHPVQTSGALRNWWGYGSWVACACVW